MKNLANTIFNMKEAFEAYQYKPQEIFGFAIRQAVDQLSEESTFIKLSEELNKINKAFPLKSFYIHQSLHGIITIGLYQAIKEDMGYDEIKNFLLDELAE